MGKKVIAFALLVTMLAVFSTSAMAAWHHDSHGWWWTESNGSYAAGMWRKINGVWYAFGYDGYMLVGAYYIDGNLYNFDASGAMSTGWRFQRCRCHESLGGKLLSWRRWCHADEHNHAGWLSGRRRWKMDSAAIKPCDMLRT